MLPEVLTVVLHTRGNARVGDSYELRSRLGWTRLAVAWRVVELWNVPAEQLFAANDIGLIPWVPLAQFSDPPAVVLQECRRRIDQQSAPLEHANLLAVTQVLTGLRYNDPQLLSLLGGKQAMIESPVLQEFVHEAVAEARQRDILRVLGARFGAVPQEIAAALRSVQDEAKLDELVDWASRSPSLEAFRSRLGA